MKILIINQPPFNRGDESAHKGLVRAILRQCPNINIKVMYSVKYVESIRQYAVKNERVEYVTEPYPSFRFESFKWQGLFKNRTWLWKYHPTIIQYKAIYEWADIVMCAPGGICMGGFQDWDHLFKLKLAKYFDKPLVYYGRSLGPFPIKTVANRRFKELSLEMLHYFSFLSIRDQESENIIKDLGVSFESTVDSAFLDSPVVEIPYEIKAAIGGKPYMVFVPNYLLWHYAYIGKITHENLLDFYCKILILIKEQKPELSIVMLPQIFCGHQYDIEFFREIASRLNDNRIIVTADCYSSDIQQTIIRDAVFLVGSRYHSIVFALNQATPFIALSYEHKIRGLLTTLERMDVCVDITNISDDINTRNSCLQQIKYLITKVYSDNDAKERAKRIASDCLMKFFKRLQLI